MAPDPYSSGDVGLIPGILVIVLAIWVSSAHRRTISKLESKAILSFGTLVITLALFPLYLIFGLFIVACAFFVSPAVVYVFGIDLRQLIMSYILVGNSVMSFVWLTLLGLVP